MKHYRRTTSCWLITQALCFCLLLQGSGIAQALPLPPKKAFVSEDQLQSARHANAISETGPLEAGWLLSGPLELVVDGIRDSAEGVGGNIKRWLQDPWPQATAEAPVRVAQGGGILPLPPRLISAFLGSTSQGHAGPPSPTGLGKNPVEKTPPAELVALLEKAGTDEIPLVAGWNLISIPEEPADPNPTAVFAAITGELARVEAFDACDLADPWKLYDPGDPAASDLTVVDHKIGMWVKASMAAILPSDGILPATTTIDLCEGWNLIGFPTGEPRHPHAALSSIAGKWLRIFGYDAFDSQDPWEFFDPNVPDWANDLRLMHPGRGYWVLASEATTLEIRNEGPPPTAAIASPADLAVITKPTEILGTVESDRLDNWTLTYRAIGDGDADAVTLATSNAPVTGGTLATFDPTLLLNGLYELQLIATDVQGQQVTESIAVAVEGQMKIGHFTLSFVDLAVPVSGLDIEVIRTYDSRDKQQRDFGIGWSLDIRQGSYRNNRAPGDGWQLQDGFVACDTALESKSHLTVVRLSDQEVYRFALQLVRGAPRNGGGCSATAEFVYVDGPIPGASLLILGNDQVFQETPSSNRVLDLDTFATYEPQHVRLTTRDGRIFELDLNHGVTLVEGLNGHQLSITPAGITHSSGKGIVFERDPEGRITHITDPMDRVMIYGYDTAGDLVSFTDREDHTARYFYDNEHLLEEIEDPRQIRPIRNDYDDSGRLTSVTDAFGKTLSLEHDLDAKREVITNRLGHVRVLEYDARGNVVREVDENQKVTLREYDSEDNLKKQIDPLLHETTYFYDGNNDLRRMVDPEQHETRFTYNNRGQILTTTDPRGKVTENRYDTRGNLEYIKDPNGAETVLTYYTNGLLHTQTDAELGITTYEYNTFGHQTRVTDALGHVSGSTYDANGNRLTDTTTRTLAGGSTETLVTTFIYDDLDRVTDTIYPDATTTKTRYDSLGKVVESTDQRQRSTLFHYDDLGRLERTEYEDETTEERIYDAEGQLSTLKDRADRLTTVEYDPVGRQTKTTFPDLKYTINRYDDAGRLTEFENARRYVTRYFYDDAGRRTKIVDALDGVFDFEYDPAGNQIAVIDANRHRTEFEYDDVGRLLRTVLPGPVVTDRHITYDDLGRRISETDQADKTTQFRYDKLGRLTKVIDALLQETDYVYDELGNRTHQIDANGHVTRFEYDALGRTTKRILPGDGKFEGMTYYADGTLESHTDFNGATRTFEYDTDRRLTRRAYPDGSAVMFTYTPTGQRKTVTDARGTTTYTYDDRDRLTLKLDPTGYSLGYGYDDQGNRTHLTATVGAEIYNTTYTYDSLDRLATVTDSQSGVTTLGYDSNGNRTSLAHPNGVTTGYTYDEQNRLENLSTATSADDILASYAYTLGPAGNRTRIDEHDGTSRHYIYDDLYRLTQDRVTDVAEAQVYQRDFVYDPVGNRLGKVVDEGSGPATFVSTYDSRDRLLTTGLASYGWNANGNLISKTETFQTTYGWDLENRLTSVVKDDGTLVETIYDADGNRVTTAVTPPGGISTAVDYLVDSAGRLSHVVVDIVSDSVQTLYTRADDQLIGLHRPASATTRFYHADGLGSVRELSDENGVVTDRYTYSAFGELQEHAGSDSQLYRFAAEPFDPNVGFAYHRARWLDLASGRFTAEDPFAGRPFEPLTLHRYSYAANNPLNMIDPSGREFNLTTALIALDVALTVISLAFGIKSLIQGDYRQAAIEFASVAFWGIAGSRKVFRLGSWWLKGRRVRVIYNNSVQAMKQTIQRMRTANRPLRSIAEEVVRLRNQAKIVTRKLMDPADVAKLEARNMKKYNNPIGPTLDELLARGDTLDDVLRSAVRSDFWYNLFFLSF